MHVMFNIICKKYSLKVFSKKMNKKYKSFKEREREREFLLNFQKIMKNNILFKERMKRETNLFFPIFVFY